MEGLLAFSKKTQCFRDGEGADAIVKGACDSEVIPQEFELIVQGDGISDLNEAFGCFFGGDPDVDE